MLLINPMQFTAFFLGGGATWDKYLLLKNWLKYLKLTEVTIYNYVKDGKIPARRVGNRWRFDKDKIDKVLGRKRKKMVKNRSRLSGGDQSN
jgi:excisionase family DNA binding protein